MTDADPAAVVDRQLDAYNRHDLEAFVETYAEDAEVYLTPKAPWISGRDALARAYGAFFKASPQVAAEVKCRIRVDPNVVDHEHVRLAPDQQPMDAIAIYTVRGGLIERVDLLPSRDPTS